MDFVSYSLFIQLVSFDWRIEVNLKLSFEMYVNCSCPIADFWWYCVLGDTLVLVTTASYVVTRCLCYAHSLVQLKTLLPGFSLGLICLYHKKFFFQFSYSG